MIAGVTAASWDLFVRQGRGVGGANQFASASDIRWDQVANAGTAGATGAMTAVLDATLLAPFILAGVVGNVLLPGVGWTVGDINQAFFSLLGLDYRAMASNPYFVAGQAGGEVAMFFANLKVAANSLNNGGFSVSGGGALRANNGMMIPVGVSISVSPQLVIGGIGAAAGVAAGLQARGSNFLLASAPDDTDPNFEQHVVERQRGDRWYDSRELEYEAGPNDLDWRGTDLTWRDALNEAFRRTGVPKDRFSITQWARDMWGKTFPTEWRGPAGTGAEISVDWPHLGYTKGPDVPHIGWKVGRGTTRRVGHIFLDWVPIGRRPLR